MSKNEKGNIQELNMEEIGNVEPMQMEKPKTMKEQMMEDVMVLRALNFSMDEVEKFGIIITKVKQDLVGFIETMEKEEVEAVKNGKADS